MSPRVRKPPASLSDLETEVMAEVWERGQATVRDVLEALNDAGGKQRAYTTVMTVMNRLDTHKGLLRRKRLGKSDVYKPAISRADYMNARAEAEVGALVSQFGDVALAHFARQVDRLDPKRARQLRDLARGD